MTIRIRLASFLVVPVLTLGVARGQTDTVPFQHQYSIRQIQPPAGHVGSRATGIDDSSVVVGNADTVTAYVWSRGVIRPLSDHRGGWSSRAEGIGPAGQVVGSAAASTSQLATVWSSTGDGPNTPELLGAAPGDSLSLVEAINAQQLAVGCTDDQILFRPAAFIADTTGYEAVALPLPAGAFAGAAHDVNDDGLIVGFTSDFGPGRAGVWKRLGMGWTHTYLPALTPGGSSEAISIDGIGRIAGHSLDAGGRSHFVVWIDHEIHDLGRPAGTSAFARAIGASGTLVGTSIDASTFGRSAILHGGVAAGAPEFVNLHDTLPAGTHWAELREATDINARGEIVGEGVLDGIVHSFLLTPIRRALHAPPSLIAGTVASFTVENATPGAEIELYIARVGGETILAGEVQSLDIAYAALVMRSVTDATGRVSIDLPIPVTAAGRPLWIQAFDRTNGEVSDVEVRLIQ